MSYYQFYEIRPRHELDDDIVSACCLEEHYQNIKKYEREPDYWTLYGWVGDEWQAIGDFKSEEIAATALQSIIAPLAEIRKILLDQQTLSDPEQRILEIAEVAVLTSKSALPE